MTFSSGFDLSVLLELCMLAYGRLRHTSFLKIMEIRMSFLSLENIAAIIILLFLENTQKGKDTGSMKRLFVSS
jgi:hypothetical protein